MVPVSCWTDKQLRLQARLTWKRLPKSARQQAVRLARVGRRHPDPGVRGAAFDLANSWFFEFTAVRIALTAGGLLIAIAFLTFLMGLPPTAGVGLFVLMVVLFAGTGITAANLRRVSLAERAISDCSDAGLARDTLVSRIRSLRHPMSLLGLALLVLGVIGPSPLLAGIWISGFACLFLGVGVMPTRDCQRTIAP